MSRWDVLFEELSERSAARRLLDGISGELIENVFEADELDTVLDLARRAEDEELRGDFRHTVFILPGFMGSKLGRRSSLHILDGNDLIWFDPFDVARGRLGLLSWDPDDNRITPAGAFHAAYLKMKLSLRARGFDARYLPYDWRKTAKENADLLWPRIQEAGEVSLVAHSQGGRVARALTKHDEDAQVIRRIVTMGTPHQGLYEPVRALGLDGNFRLLNFLANFGGFSSPQELVRDVVMNLPGLIEMMPLIGIRPNEDFFDPNWWPTSSQIPAADVFERAHEQARSLPDPDERLLAIVGVGHADTPGASTRNGGVLNIENTVGDGTVAQDLAEFPGVATKYTDAKHGFMANDPNVIEAVFEVLSHGATNALPDTPDSIQATTSSLLTDVAPGEEIRSILGLEAG